MKRFWLITMLSVVSVAQVALAENNSADGQEVALPAVINEEITREIRENAASAIDELASALNVNRKIIDKSYKTVEQGLNPKTYQRILALRQEVAKLVDEKDELLKSAQFGPDHDFIKRIDFKLEEAKNKLEDLIRDEKILHWRTFLSLGIGLTVGTLVWRLRKKGIWGKSWRAVLYGFLTTSIVEFLLRTRHAVVPGLVFRGLKEACKGIGKGLEKLFGVQGASDRAGRWLEDAFHTQAGEDIDKALDGALGPILAGVVSVGAIVAAAKLSKNRKSDSANIAALASALSRQD